MNFQSAGIATLAFLMGLVPVGFVTLGATPASMAQTNQGSAYDPLNAFVGTWTATTPGERSPYLVLQFKETNGKLTGTTTHFKLKLSHSGKIAGRPAMQEKSPLANLKFWGSDLAFTWDGDSDLQGVQAKFVVQGTQQALLVLIVTDEKTQVTRKIMQENPGVTGFIPAISLNRETETGSRTQTETTAGQVEATFMAQLINTAEAQYKFTYGRYANYGTLLHSGQLKDTSGREFTWSPNFASETGPIPRYRLRLLLSPDASSYQLAIQEKTAACGTSLFSNETGIIFEGPAAANCPLSGN